MIKYFFLLFSLFSAASNNATLIDGNLNWKIVSPNSKLRFVLHLNSAGQLSYTIYSKNNISLSEIIENSPLGIVRIDQSFEYLKFIGFDKEAITKEQYLMSTGKQLQNVNHFAEQKFHFQNSTGSKMDFVVRLYNDGVAFRYIFPETSNNIYTVNKELTGFNLPENGLSWMQAYDKASDYAPAYERNYEQGLPIGTAAPSIEGWAFPSLFEVNNHWVLISEANIDGNFYGSHLNQNAEKGLYTIANPFKEEALGYGTTSATATLPWIMPWRVIIIGNKLSNIVNSNLVHHVSDKSIIEDTSWIKPGRASWAWWSGYLDKSSDTPEKLKKFIDFAQTMNWEYSLIDAGWESRKGLDTAELIQYAKSKDVDLLLWYNSGGPTNKVDAGPRDLMFYPDLREKEMKRISDLGYKGIKIDFFGSDKQALMQLYIDILKDAAKYKLLVNFHGGTMPRGWSRTYPHLVSMESVKGSEGYIYHSDFEEKAPVHNTVLPFTRNIVGSMDYTPTAFSFQQFPHKTTYAHELALSVVFESGIQHYPDTPEAYLKTPVYVQEFLKLVPAAWDKTQLLNGYPGKEITLARKHGDDWFVGCINGENISKETEIDFSFLDKEKYELQIISDGSTKLEFQTETQIVNRKSKIKIKSLPFGGFVLKIIKSKNIES